MTSDDTKDLRRLELQTWAFNYLEEQGYQNLEPIRPVSDDASFRRYFRLKHSKGTLICVDAPPDKEDNESFVLVQGLLEKGGVNVPHLVHFDLKLGFLLLSDLGDDLLLGLLKDSALERQVNAYENALSCLGEVVGVETTGLPNYNESRLLDEMSLFPDWLLDRQLKVERYDGFNQVAEAMVENAQKQPQVFVHRDFHARNLMTLGEELGVIDFQDAVVGPITYDLVSLLKDCYWKLPRQTVVQLVDTFRREHAHQTEPATFLRWFDWMGFQRHLKCAGIFCRLNLRDGKPGYLKDIPLVIDYLIEVAQLYTELKDFGAWLSREIKPNVAELADQQATSK